MLSLIPLVSGACALAVLPSEVQSRRIDVDVTQAGPMVEASPHPEDGLPAEPDGLVVRTSGDGHVEDRIFVSIPGFGNATLVEATTVGGAAWQVIQDLGLSLSSFYSVSIHTPFSSHGEGILMLMPPESCLGDFNGDGRLTASDASLFAQAYQAGDPSADLNRNGNIDAFDQMIFFQLLTTGTCVVAW